MSETISKYFSGKLGNKRRQSSSSGTDSCDSPVAKKSDSKKLKQDSSVCDTASEMALQDTLSQMQATMAKLATKEDIDQLKDNMKQLTDSLTLKIDKLESEVFEMAREKDLLKEELTKLRGENADLRGQLSKQTKEVSAVKVSINDHEQHGRSWNLRVFGVPETAQETANDCTEKVVSIFTSKLQVPVQATDVENAHRVGKAPEGKGGRPRPIIVRFFSRKQRGLVLAARRKLKQSGVSVGEDLTQANYKLLRAVNGHSAVMSSWSWGGRIFAKLKNGKTVKVDLNTEVDTLFRKEMQ